jgi:hypothetical protein
MLDGGQTRCEGSGHAIRQQGGELTIRLSLKLKLREYRGNISFRLYQPVAQGDGECGGIPQS